MNHAWERLALEPLDISLRSQIGQAVEREDLPELGARASELVRERELWRERIEQVMRENLYHVGAAAEQAAAYLVEAVARHEEQRQALLNELAGRGALMPTLEELEAKEARERGEAGA
jgi:hypothetical protein